VREKPKKVLRMSIMVFSAVSEYTNYFAYVC